MVNPNPPKPRGRAAARRTKLPDPEKLTGVSNAAPNSEADPSELSDSELAKTALRAILTDENAPAAARAQAARTLAEMVGALGRHSKPVEDGRKPLGEMTREELEAELAGLVQ